MIINKINIQKYLNNFYEFRIHIMGHKIKVTIKLNLVQTGIEAQYIQAKTNIAVRKEKIKLQW